MWHRCSVGTNFNCVNTCIGKHLAGSEKIVKSQSTGIHIRSIELYNN